MGIWYQQEINDISHLKEQSTLKESHDIKNCNIVTLKKTHNARVPSQYKDAVLPIEEFPSQK